MPDKPLQKKVKINTEHSKQTKEVNLLKVEKDLCYSFEQTQGSFNKSLNE